MDYKTLKEQVRYHDLLYYVHAKPILSDAEYDGLYDQLVALEKSQGYRDYDSPTVKVGAIDHRQGLVKHPNRLYSLEKVYDKKEVPREFTVETPKLDGACVANHCNKGKIVSTLTRGDGEYGENISFLFEEQFTNFSMEREEFLGVVTIVCEAVTFQKVDNYRNYVAGALNLKDKTEFLSRQIVLVVHDVLGVDLPYTERLEYLASKGFNTVLDTKVLQDIPQDGVVYRTNSLEREHELGYTSKYPKFAIALKKRATETAQTILKDIIWAVGRTGMVNPTGIVEPVIIGGATVSRLTLHNLAFIEDNNICLGDKIEIERAGEIIPTFVRIVEKSPVRIAITAQNAEEAIGNSVNRVGPRLYVADKSVNDEKVLLNYITHVNIQGLGPASISKMGLSHISDLYKPQNWDSLGANGKKIAQEIEYSKTKAYEHVLAGLGIPGVGASLAKKIIQRIPKFSDLHKIEFEKIDKIGPILTDKILTWYDDNVDWVLKLPVQLEQTIAIDTIRRPICITGTLDRPRKELAEILEQKGFEVKSSVTKKTYALITDGKIESDKTATASKYGVRVINYFDHKDQVLEGKF
jgi:DNA ligase (NAD+)